MIQIDKIIFGDNQFFGINHSSQDKAEEMAKKFSDINNILKVYDIAFNCGIKAVMLNSNERAAEITQYFRDNIKKYSDLTWYPSIPYPHKYADMVNELGILPAINEAIFKNNTAGGLLSMVTKGATVAITKDAMKVTEMLIDVEYKMFKGLDCRVLFLQNVITDLLLGLNIKEFFLHYCEYIKKKYKILPGFITLNMPYLKRKLEEWGIEEVVICSTVNAAGFNMYPSKEEYERVIAANDASKYQLMGMNILASGSITPKQSFDYINGLNLQSVVFGASSQEHIKDSFESIKL